MTIGVKQTDELEFAFEGNKVETFILDGKVYFNPKNVGACLGMAPSTVRDHIQDMNDKQVRLFDNSDDGLTVSRKLNNMGENFLTESGVFKLIFKSRKPNAEKFTDWVTDWVLPTIRKTGTYTMTTTKEIVTDTVSEPKKRISIVGIQIRNEINALKEIQPLFKFTREELQEMINKIYDRYELPTDVWPSTKSKPKIFSYAPDPVPVPEPTKKSYSVSAATELLAINECSLSARAFNRLMVRAGYLDSNIWFNDKGEKRYTKTLIGEGLKYGQNTQVSSTKFSVRSPYYFRDTFMDLYNKIVYFAFMEDDRVI
jgi:prophage antirepressor-like protein